MFFLWIFYELMQTRRIIKKIVLNSSNLLIIYCQIKREKNFSHIQKVSDSGSGYVVLGHFWVVVQCVGEFLLRLQIPPLKVVHDCKLIEYHWSVLMLKKIKNCSNKGNN